ncbi:MAG: tRNA lysidine(34) synthetase TilS, partial [Deltaproteobacteria bacterium]|nr:tRNA lysidine(34) synthetase TilS [Deltaproteobacteria bacterium]
MSFPGKITSVIEEFGLFSKGDTVCVAVSGGVDSVVLLYLLSELSKTFRLKIIVCHLNHNLRGVESRADYNFTKKLAKGMGFIFEGKVLPKGKLTKKTNESLQEMARKERLNFLECTRRKFSADCIVLGHNQDDRAETVLMRLLKGTSLRGLTSIAPKRGFFVRPLINTSRSEIEEFAKAREIKFRVDSSNKSRKYLRNKVRLDLLPALEQEYNPRIREALSRLASLVSIDDDFIEEATTRALSKKNNLLTKTAGGVLIDRLKFLKLHKAVQGRVLLKAINLIVKDRVKADVFVEDISNFNIYGSHLDAVQGVILSLRPNLSIDLPEGIYFIREYDKLRFTRDLPKEVVFNLPLKVGAVKKIKQLGLEVKLRILKNKPKTVSQNPFVTH